jgi:endonuclease G, mitochondrial
MRALVLMVLSGCLSAPAWAQSIPSECRRMVAATGVPFVRAAAADGTILCRDGYLLLHSSERKTPYWVAERLTPANFVGPGDRKAQGDPFAKDPDLESEGLPAAAPGDYLGKKSRIQKRSFDRGHMAPAANMKFSEEATTESFYMSNMAPQQGLNLNRHIWADLEAVVRRWACDRRDLYVFTGPIYDEQEPDTLGPAEVAVPTAFFKIAFEPRQKRAIAFILPNEAVPKKRRKPEEVLGDYLKRVHEVEERTGIRFFQKLDARKRRQVVDAASPMWSTVRGCKDNDE